MNASATPASLFAPSAPLQLQRAYLMNAVNQLTKWGVPFAVIDFDGKTHGTLAVARQAPKKKRRPNLLPRGDAQKFVTPFLADMECGDVSAVPCQQYEINTVQKWVANACITLWGKGTYKTSQNRNTNSVEVIRYFPLPPAVMAHQG